MGRGMGSACRRAGWVVAIAGTLVSVLPGVAGATSVVPHRGSVSAVAADGADDTEQKLAKEVFDAMCSRDEDDPKYTNEWYQAVESWQAITPYTLKRSYTPEAAARENLYGQPRLTNDTRKAMCGGMTSYANALKDAVLDLKGDIRDGCATTPGLGAFYDFKMEAFRAIDDHDWAKVDKIMPGWRDPATFAENTGANGMCTKWTGVTDAA
ncbi:hypothetical protein [Streptomyces sp. NBC_01465]|uniref:hypothetical protein n=1 Tax=Streptomyces sp. NBC_01465 TaxID=2903878 RepID=UPI002E31CEFB|nr:hypothetical protein [Streptomyces sp. NBC_01465]